MPNIKRKSGEIDYYQDTAQPFLKKNGETIISHKNDASLREIAGIYNFKYREPSDIDTIISEAKEKVNTGWHGQYDFRIRNLLDFHANSWDFIIDGVLSRF